RPPSDIAAQISRQLRRRQRPPRHADRERPALRSTATTKWRPCPDTADASYGPPRPPAPSPRFEKFEPQPVLLGRDRRKIADVCRKRGHQRCTERKSRDHEKPAAHHTQVSQVDDVKAVAAPVLKRCLHEYAYDLRL